MKRSINAAYVMVCALSIFITGCQSTKNEIVQSEEKGTAVKIIENAADDSTENDELEEYLLAELDEESDKGFIKSILGSSRYVPYNTGTVFVKSLTGEMKEQNIEFIINKKRKNAGISSSYLMAYCYLNLDDFSRHMLKKAVDNYLNDFEQKRLDRKNKKSYMIYGSSQIFFEWGAVKSNIPNRGEGPAFFGYKFVKEKSDGKTVERPYFTITINPVANQNGVADGDESFKVNYYFTKAQAAELSKKLNNKSVEKYLHLSDMYDSEYETKTEIAGDEY